jgi:hypothetical protein
MESFLLQDFVQAGLQGQVLFQDGHQHVHSDRDPHLCFDSIGCGAVEGVDPKVLPDPFEEQLDLPAELVGARDRSRRQVESVGQEHEAFVEF